MERTNTELLRAIVREVEAHSLRIDRLLAAMAPDEDKNALLRAWDQESSRDDTFMLTAFGAADVWSTGTAKVNDRVTCVITWGLNTYETIDPDDDTPTSSNVLAVGERFLSLIEEWHQENQEAAELYDTVGKAQITGAVVFEALTEYLEDVRKIETEI